MIKSGAVETLGSCKLSRHRRELSIFCTEISQNIQGWELFVERVLRQEKCGVFLSGSSAKMLSREISTELRGRSLPFEVFPYSFQERLAIQKIDPHLAAAKNLNRIAKAFREHLIRGGFPEVFDADERTRLIILQDYFRTVLYRDVVERYNVSTPHKELRAMQLLCHQAGGLFTATKIAQKLKAQGVPASPNDILTLVGWLNDAYFFYPVPVYSESLARQNTNPKKAYLVDTGMLSVLHAGTREIWGHLLENLVFMELRRKTEQIFYYKDRAGREVDFVTSHKGRIKLMQVAHDISDDETKKRETRSLWSAMDELGLKEGYIFTTDTTENIRRDKKTIHVLPAWKGVEQIFS